MTTLQEEVELIAYLLQEEVGFTKNRANNIAAVFAEGGVEEFCDATADELASMRSPKNRPLLRGDEPSRVVSAARKYDRGQGVKENWVSLLANSFTARQLQRLNELGLENLTINPFLVRSLKLEGPDDIVRFNVYQAVTRSIVTSMGNTIEAIALRSGGERIEQGNSGFDLKKTVDDATYWIQVKSGTNTMNVDMVRYFREKAKEKEGQDSGNVAKLGLTYGKKSQVSGQIRGNLPQFDERVVVGRELWEFLSGEVGYHDFVLDAMEAAAQRALGDESVVDAIESSISRITSEFQETYGDGPEAVKRAIQDFI